MLPAPEFDLRGWLTDAEQRIFYAQSGADQRHALRVAHHLLARGHSDQLLIRAALLHDVGKAGVRVPVLARVIWVLAGRVSPRLQPLLARRGGAWRALAEHPSVGASRLRVAGAESRIVALVAGRPLPGDEARLELLAAADESV